MNTGYSHEADYARLSKQVEKVATVMSDGQWHILAEISKLTGCPEASISARLRGLRQAGNTVEKKRIGSPKQGLWAYRVLPPSLGALSAMGIPEGYVYNPERW